ncbi:MAG: hypothetical protein KAT70_06375 [Thermoplasmata archaeon]|nr:hypothetical protein [Thermoplasmata archaeon]
MPFKHRLKGKIGTRIAVVMSDGTCFRGVVRAVEENILVLDGVEESSVGEIDWEGIDEGEGGVHRWVKVNLPEAYLNTAHISRVWPWPREEVAKEKKEYIYLRETLKVI